VTPLGKVAHLAYVNPETGQECMPTLGFSAIMLRPGEEVRMNRRSSSAVFHVVTGGGSAVIDGVEMQFQEADTFAAPTHATTQLRNASKTEATYLFMVDDAPMQRKLGFYESFGS
jgi:gentisate 1,2-dioxygenase